MDKVLIAVFNDFDTCEAGYVERAIVRLISEDIVALRQF